MSGPYWESTSLVQPLGIMSYWDRHLPFWADCLRRKKTALFSHIKNMQDKNLEYVSVRAAFSTIVNDRRRRRDNQIGNHTNRQVPPPPPAGRV
ncbi:hypothetical protein QC761_0075160 [Podospora bellae-mahoneyi]|uniref:Uncharacterized protein n=1 Tax=Podospora bellae-mahoneyi TaxID=2093777 RepID=A0ABR0FC28_9PEZI|nr:hypothetical protein QC761_0075160 [Podospora bellae-mahoneyi]